eukprot:TRINITY_DN85236_c0_g1_i1.p1 TRINITY_DN85236_c0_g1~~TRINITY_DN85236_c0_g1_i1.p1  ORF type:complete len:101 (-),score=14.51 TRINITY_DN85236_c0_g1_i1:30-332(-)
MKNSPIQYLPCLIYLITPSTSGFSSLCGSFEIYEFSLFGNCHPTLELPNSPLYLIHETLEFFSYYKRTCQTPKKEEEERHGGNELVIDERPLRYFSGPYL